jgi:Protein of unknown function (DUF2889)
MPLSQPVDRNLLHLRDIDLRGYLRSDGLIDIEAHMTDTKTYSFGNRDRGAIHAGEPLHGMWMRLTVNREMTVVACEAAMDATPYGICPGAAPNFARLAGLTIGKGFLKGAMERVGGTQGCTHLRELLQQVGTVAFQTLFSVKSHPGATGGADGADGAGGKADPEQRQISAALLNTCHAYDEAGPLVAKYRTAAQAGRTPEAAD